MEILEHYPVEVLHWSGMDHFTVENLERIISKYPHYINTVNKENDNGLFIAIRNNNPNTISYFMEKSNIDLFHSNKDGNAFNYATYMNNTQLSFLLAEKGLDINLIDSKGNNPLFNSASHGNDVLIEFFIEKGVDFNCINSSQENILFPFVNNYIAHQNYYCFELILDQMSDDIVFRKNNSRLNIYQYMNFLIDDALKQKNNLRVSLLQKIFEPLRYILSFREH